MSGGDLGNTKMLLDAVPDYGEFEEGVAVDAWVWCVALSVFLSEPVYNEFVESDANVDEVVRNVEFVAYKGGIRAAASAGCHFAGDWDFHGDSEYVVAGVF